MDFIERKKRLDYLLEMIKKGKCTSSSQMAKKFNCSTRTIERMFTKLRDEGVALEYCRDSKKYKLVEK